MEIILYAILILELIWIVKGLYKIISTCNEILDDFDNNEYFWQKEPELVDKMENASRFIRYFILINWFRKYKVLNDTGNYGEFLIYQKLKKIPGTKKFLFNVYIPKAKKEDETSEIDIIMIHETGIYVFESKNFSGWIFGNENDKMWTQSLGSDKHQKYRFYNPIKQNQAHIYHLTNKIGENKYPIFSYIVFSERCKLKNITQTTNKHVVLKRDHLKENIEKSIQINPRVIKTLEVYQIFQDLYRYILVDKEIKQKHIENIKNNIKNDVYMDKYTF